MTDPIDIVERLCTDVVWHERRGNETIAADCRKAAAEITRLRAELAEAQKLARDDFDLRAEQRDERDRLRAALAAQVPQWRPMDSVPKDGRRVLVAIEGVDRAVVAMWNGGVWETVDGNCWTGRAITHWMPLPAAPGASPQPAAVPGWQWVPAGRRMAQGVPGRGAGQPLAVRARRQESSRLRAG